MIAGSLTLGDIVGCLRGVLAFVPILLAPGYCLAWALDFLGFRGRPAGERLAWAIALSFGVVTIAAVMMGKYWSLAAFCSLCSLCMAGLLGIVAVELWQQPRGDQRTWSRRGVALAVAWVLFVAVELVDIAVGKRLYLSVTIFDHSMRTAFVDAVMRTGVPPTNPLYWPGHAVPMRYYYFWYVLTAAAARLGGITSRQAMIASTAWAGFGLVSILALYCRHFLGRRRSGEAGRWSRVTVALALLAVTGLDLLPAITKGILRLPMDADADWWSPDQVGSWMDALLWVPHHIAGLVCCLFGFLLVWMSKDFRGGQRGLCALVAGLSFASAFGLSTWVAVAFALVLLHWMAWVLWREPEFRSRLPVLLGAGLVSALALTTYVAELFREASGGAAGFLKFGVRHMIDPDAMLAVPGFAQLAVRHPRIEDAIAGLILLLPGFFAELGFFGLVLVLALRAARRMQLDDAARTSLVLVCAGLIVATFLRSAVVQNNDFGIRSILVAQFFLLLLAVLWCEGAFGAPGRGLALAMLWLGVAGTVYQAVELRVYLPVQEWLGRPDQRGFAEQAMAWRNGFEALDRSVPRSAVVQFNPEQPSDYFRYAEILQAGRQMATAMPDCASAFGGDPASCPAVESGVRRLFSPGDARSAAEARGICSALGISYLIASRWDGVWLDSDGWVWTLPAVADTGDVRVVDCAAV